MQYAKYLGACALVTSSAWLAGCNTLIERDIPGATYGRIEVGTPRIVSRERLVNDRLEQEEFLRKWLARAEFQSFDANAKTDIRSLALTSMQLGLRADPGLAGNVLQQERFNNLVRQSGALDASLADIQKAAVDQIAGKVKKGEMTAGEAKDELAKIGLSFPAAPSPTNTVTASTTFGFSTTAASGLNSVTLPPTNTITTTDLRGSPIDLFRDQLALREEIRGELIDNSLDDTHDLLNNTLVRLNIDAMVFPEHDTSAWAEITVKVKRRLKRHDPRSMALALQAQIEDELREHAHRILNLPEGACDKRRDGKDMTASDRINCLTELTIPSDSMRAAMRVQMYNEVQAYSSAGNARPINDLGVRQLLSLKSSTVTIPARNSPTGSTTPSGPSTTQTVSTISPSELGSNIFRLLQGAYANVFVQRYQCYFVYNDHVNKPYGGVTSESIRRQYQFDPNISVRPRNWNDPGVGVPELQTALRNCGWKTVQEAQDKTLHFWDGLTSPVNEVVSVYGVMPKETVQRISEVASRRAASEFALGLNAVAPGGNVNALMSAIRANEAFNQAIRRQPLVVGFTAQGMSRYEHGSTTTSVVVSLPNGATATATTDAYSTAPTRGPVHFGWIMGPQFKIAPDGHAGGYRHRAQQQMLSALLSLPRHWTQAELEVTTRWVKENGTSTQPVTQHSMIELPGRPAALLDVIAQDYITQKYQTRRPEALALLNPELVQGERATIVVEGLNSWRNAELYVGNQKAESIRMLPDMRGIVATFAPIGNMAGADRNAQGYPIVLRTAEGSARVGYAQLRKPAAPAAPFSFLYTSEPRLVGTTSFSLTSAPALAGYQSLSVLALPTTGQGTASFTDVRVAGSSINVNVPGDKLAGLTSGHRVRLYVKLQLSATDPEMTYPLSVEPVVYRTEADAKVAVTGLTATMATFPASVFLGLPPGMREAWPSAQGPLKLKVEDALHKGEQIGTTACQPNPKGVCKVDLLARREHLDSIEKLGARLVLSLPEGWPDLSLTEATVLKKP